MGEWKNERTREKTIADTGVKKESKKERLRKREKEEEIGTKRERDFQKDSAHILLNP